MKRILAFLLAVIMCSSLLVGCGSKANTSAGSAGSDKSAAGTASWTPGKRVEVVVPNDAGGGTDIFARKVVSIIDTNGFAKGTTFEVVNKGGGSGAIGGSYVLSKKGDNNTIIFASTAFWTTPISGKADYSYQDFTPLVEMSQDDLVLAVSASAGYSDAKSFIADAKSAKGKVSFCGTSLVSEGGLLNFAFQNQTGAETKWVPYDSSGEATTAVMGGHVTATWANYGEIKQQIESGDLVILATATEERMKDLPDVPTMRELGYDVEIVQHRHVAGPPEMSPEAAQYYSDLFQKVYDTPEFQQYVTDNALTANFVPVGEWTERYAEIGAEYEPLVSQAMAAGT